MMEWFRQVNPKYKECVRRILTTSCFDCFIDICGWGDAERPQDAFMSIGALSGHGPFQETWQGRVRAAIAALRGRASHDIDFSTKEEAMAFASHVIQVADETWPDGPPPPPPNVKVMKP